MRVLVIGASGQVGGQLVRRLAGHEVLGTGFADTARFERLDLADTGAVQRRIAEFGPEIVFVPGGVTAVDWCEGHRGDAERICVAGSAAVQRAANGIGAHVVHFSTDYVFAGSDGPYGERDRPDPLSAYGEVKWAAERAIASEGGSWAIVRTSMVYSQLPGGKNFLQFVVDRLSDGREVMAYRDQTGSPTWAPALAEAAIEIGMRRLAGLWHVAGPQVFTRFEWAVAVARAFALPEDRVRGVEKDELVLGARRPGPRGGLRVDRARRELRAPLVSLDEALERMTSVERPS